MIILHFLKGYKITQLNTLYRLNPVRGSVTSMVSALDFGSNGLGYSPGGNSVVWACLGQACDGLASHPGGSRNTASLFMLQKP